MSSVPILTCRGKGCGEQIVLPHQTLPDKPVAWFDLHTGDGPLTLLCSKCGVLSVYCEPDVRWGVAPTPDPRLPPVALYVVTLACNEENCDLRIVVYIQAAVTKSLRAIADQVRCARPRCAKGHYVTDQAEVISVKPVQA